MSHCTLIECFKLHLESEIWSDVFLQSISVHWLHHNSTAHCTHVAQGFQITCDLWTYGCTQLFASVAEIYQVLAKPGLSLYCPLLTNLTAIFAHRFCSYFSLMISVLALTLLHRNSGVERKFSLVMSQSWLWLLIRLSDFHLNFGFGLTAIYSLKQQNL